jgi:mitochondrial import inner membrane translocase subunit TIM44
MVLKLEVLMDPFGYVPVEKILPRFARLSAFCFGDPGLKLLASTREISVAQREKAREAGIFPHHLILPFWRLPLFEGSSRPFSVSILRMNTFARHASSAENALARATAQLNHPHGRTTTYRRLASTLSQPSSSNGLLYQKTALPCAAMAPLRSHFLPSELRLSPLNAPARMFHATSLRAQEKPATEAKAEPAAENTEAKDKEANPEEAKKAEGEKEEGKEDKDKEGKEEDDKTQEKKEDLPPPPPHGDKTPWQVFMETMNTEFEKSKEWNESTKQIGAAAHQFSESESVRRAREAYEKSTGAVSSAASGAIKSTAGAIGKGAAWTWDTSMMKGVRKAANVTGDAVDKATKPIRDTEAYKNVKNVIDDGSSSRYGGWVEKEERRKQRELRESQRADTQVHQEDPK